MVLETETRSTQRIEETAKVRRDPQKEKKKRLPRIKSGIKAYCTRSCWIVLRTPDSLERMKEYGVQCTVSAIVGIINQHHCSRDLKTKAASGNRGPITQVPCRATLSPPFLPARLTNCTSRLNTRSVRSGSPPFLGCWGRKKALQMTRHEGN